MTTSHPTIRELRQSLAAGTVRPSELARTSLARMNQNAGRNTYLWQDPAWTLAESSLAESSRAESPPAQFNPLARGVTFADGRHPLWGLPISVKDCFDLAGSPTSCGVHFYRDLNGIATRDSWLVEQLRNAGAVIVGKTHLHALAYGITGENPEFGDCVQPTNPQRLTGGSSSGAAASVQEGSAVAAIGTDTGGSIRVPAALCGLAGYRSSLGRGNWRGGAHLAESFDTMGWLFRDLRDAPLLAAPFAGSASAPQPAAQSPAFTSFAFLADTFLNDCEPQVADCFRSVIRELESLGLESRVIDPGWWSEAVEIFAPIQASEAARVHTGNFDRFEPAIRDRLKWGAAFTSGDIAALRQRHDAFRQRMDELFAADSLLLLPCAPVASLAAGEDHTQTRSRLLRYTAPFSLAGVPTVAIPCAYGGMQLAAARGSDESLLALAAQIGLQRNARPIS